MTDENFDPAFPGESLWTPNASQRNTCSADGKYCYIEGPSFRTYLLSVSWPSGSAAPSFQSLGQIPGGGVTCRTSVFSFTDPDTLYCLDVGSPKIWQYSVSKKTLTLLVDPLASCPGLAAQFPAGEREYGNELTNSANGLLAEAVGPAQDRDPVAFFYDPTRGCRWFNTQTLAWYGDWGTLGPIPNPSTMQAWIDWYNGPRNTPFTGVYPFELHAVNLFRDGKVLDAGIAFGTSPKGETGEAMLEVESGRAQMLFSPPSRPCWAGHKGYGPSSMIGPCNDAHGGNDLVVTPEDQPWPWQEQTHLVSDIPPSSTWMDSHYTWNNLTGIPCRTTFHNVGALGPGVPPTIDGPWEWEVDCYSLTEENTVYRISHNWGSGHSYKPNDQNSIYGCTMDQQGTFLLCPWDWLDSLGGREDVFAVVLASRQFPAVSVSPSALTFGNVALGHSGSPQSVTLTNTGAATLQLGSITAGGDFAVSLGSCGASLAASANCNFSVTFSPLSAGTRTGTVTITDNASGSPQEIPLSGTGIGPAASVSPASLSFGDQLVGGSSAAQTVTLTSTGTVSLGISGVTVSEDFSQTNNCGASLSAGASCTISVQFKPTAVGAVSGALTISNSAPDGPSVVTLTGRGTRAILTLSPAGGLAFADQLVGGQSSAQNLTASNSGDAALSLSPIAITGANSADFTQTNTCGNSLGAGKTCTISVTFRPGAVGPRTAALTIASNSVSGPTQTAALSGKGTAPQASLSPARLALASTAVGAVSPAGTATLSNSGTAPLTISAITIGGKDPADFAQTDTCGSVLAAGSSCAISVTFTPAAAAVRSATLSVSDNSGAVAGSSQTVELSGAGLGTTLIAAPASLSFEPQLAGGSSSAQSVTVTNASGSTVTLGNVGISANFGVAAGSTCKTGTALPAGAACTVDVVFSPAAGGNLTGSLTLAGASAGGPEASVALAGTGEDFALTAPPPGTSAVISAGQTAAYNLTLAPAGGLNEPIAVACSLAAPAPAGASCFVTPAQVTPSGNSAASVTVSIRTSSGAAAPPRLPAAPFSGSPAAWMLLLLTPLLIRPALRRRRKPLVALPAMLLMAALAAACGGGGAAAVTTAPQARATPAGTYYATVSATCGTLVHQVQLTITVH